MAAVPSFAITPKTVERIDLEADDVQIVHVHGTYWFFDCCNLKQEMVDRAQSSSDTSFTMASLLDNILLGRSPLVVDYSGWEGDVIMAALKRRLSVGLRNNLYWFCYRRADVDRLPLWLASKPNVCAVLPPEASQSDISSGASVEGRLATSFLLGLGPKAGIKGGEPTLAATAVLEAKSN